MIGLTGFVITKLDGTAKGGIALALADRFGVPVRSIGVGEALEDLQDFNPPEYVEAMLGEWRAGQPETTGGAACAGANG
jgi:fused signal recognition particle receptor